MDDGQGERVFAAMMTAALRSKTDADPVRAASHLREAETLAQQLLATGVAPSVLVAQVAGVGMAMFSRVVSSLGLDPEDLGFSMEAAAALQRDRDDDASDG